MPAASDRRRRAVRSGALAGVLAVAIASCGSGDDGDGPATTGATVTTTATTVVGSGQGSIDLGGAAEALTVVSCTTEPGPDDTPESTQELRVEATGSTAGTDFSVTATRFRSETPDAPLTITETVSVRSGSGDDLVGLEAKRSSVGGEWIDLNDPAASGPLLTRAGDTVSAEATFGPEGSQAGDEGLVAGSFVARCPA